MTASAVLGIIKLVRQEDIWDADVAERYDTPGEGMFDPAVLGPTVERLADLAGGGRVLEFAIGTGRVAVPLAQLGISVTGIELSEAMLAQLRRKADAAALPVLVGDMATTRAPGEFSLVYLVFNTLSNLRTQPEQVECFRNAARHLSPGGRFVIELWVPAIRRMPPGQDAVPMSLAGGHLIFDTYDLATQQCTSHHYFRVADGSTRYTAREVPPAVLIALATIAGREEIPADW